jgi:hypothetical protein
MFRASEKSQVVAFRGIDQLRVYLQEDIAMRRQNILKILTEHSSEIESRFGVASLSLFGSVARKKKTVS